MATYYFEFYEFSDFTFTGSAGSTSETQGFTSGSFTLNGGAAPIAVVVDDNDPDFHDGFQDPNVNGLPSTANNDQELLAPITVNGTEYPAGTQIELEFAVSTNSTEGDDIIFYYIRINGINIGIVAASGTDFVEGVQYVITGWQDGNGDTGGAFPAGEPTAVPWDTIVCFTYGTKIETPEGPRLIDELVEGDLITTLDNGSQAVRWVGTRKISMIDMMGNPALRPVRFETGTIGNDRPLLVSPQHRMLLNDWRAQVYFGEEQVLIAAKGLINGTTIKQVMPPEGVTYCHLLFDQHEILIAEGALSESFHPGEMALDILTDDQQREIELLFPELSHEIANRNAAYPVVKSADARGLRLVG